MVQFCCGVLSRSPSRCERAETRTASPRLIPYPREIIQEQIASILPLLNQPRSPTPFRLQHRSYQAACQKQHSYLEEWYRTHWSKSVCLNIRVFLEGTGGDRREVRVAERWDYHGGIKTFRRRTRVKKKSSRGCLVRMRIDSSAYKLSSHFLQQARHFMVSSFHGFHHFRPMNP